MSCYIIHLRWAGFNPAEVTLCVSCKRRELLSDVKLANLSTAVSLSQLTKPAASSKDSCGAEVSLDCGRTRPPLDCAKLTIQDATVATAQSLFDKLARREGIGLTSVQEGKNKEADYRLYVGTGL